MARFLVGLIKSALFARVVQMIRRAMAKPENQQRAKDWLNRTTSRIEQQKRARRAT